MSRGNLGQHHGQPYIASYRQGKAVFQVKCSEPGCAAEHTTAHKPDCPPDQVCNSFRRKGWHITKHDCTCPACLQKRKMKPKQVPTFGLDLQTYEAKHMNGDKVVPISSPLAVLQPPQLEAPKLKPGLRAATAKEIVAISDALAMHFDSAHDRYTEGWNDQKIGQELNLPWALVEHVREELGYKIKIDSALSLELSQCRKDIAEINKMASEQLHGIRDMIKVVESQLINIEEKMKVYA